MPPVSETFYRGTLDAAFPGMLANMEPKTIISRTNETDAIIGFGWFVLRGSQDGAAVNAYGPTAVTADNFLGVTCIDRAAYASPDLETEGFRPGDNMRILRTGVIWMMANVAVTAGAPVRVDAALGTMVQTGGIVLPRATYETSASAGEMVKVRLD